MMNRPSNWDNIQGKDAGEYASLPPGVYCCRITNAEATKSQNTNKEMLVLTLDVASGEHKGIFASSQYPPMYRQLTGNDDGDEKKQSFFKGLITAIEKSNDGYKWDWNPAGLVGKLLAVAFGEEEYLNKDGALATSVKPRFVRSTQQMREGTIEVPALKKLNGNGNNATVGSNYAPPSATQSGTNGFSSLASAFIEEDDDLPF